MNDTPMIIDMTEHTRNWKQLNAAREYDQQRRARDGNRNAFPRALRLARAAAWKPLTGLHIPSGAGVAVSEHASARYRRTRQGGIVRTEDHKRDVIDYLKRIYYTESAAYLPPPCLIPALRVLAAEREIVVTIGNEGNRAA